MAVRRLALAEARTVWIDLYLAAGLQSAILPAMSSMQGENLAVEYIAHFADGARHLPECASR